ncbi:MAG TPA: hypothetical protein VJ796_06045 [Acidimicrobiia bacterium]|nr:hypothetical protein [Acidimicrobiia bacterium]
MIEESPSEPAPKSKTGLVVVVIAIALVLVGIGLWLALGSLGRSSFESLVTVTREAEGDQIWLDYFIAQDCLVDAVVETGDLELGFTESQDLLDQTDALSRHVNASLDRFSEVGIQPWQGPVLAAREAIVAHYEVWENHLAESATVLQGINSEPSSILQGVQTWINLVVEATEPIEQTFNDAGAAFEEAASNEEQLASIETLFVPADVACTRTAV